MSEFIQILKNVKTTSYIMNALYMEDSAVSENESSCQVGRHDCCSFGTPIFKTQEFCSVFDNNLFKIALHLTKTESIEVILSFFCLFLYTVISFYKK
jgi:hypothetical protein